MANSLGDELCIYLQGQSLPTALNFNGVGTINLFSTYLPDQPDLAAAITERPGLPPQMMLQDPVSKLDKPNIQIMVRSGMTDWTDGNALMEGIFGALQNLAEATLNVGGAYFHLIQALGSPAYLGIARDKRERHLWSLNMNVMWENDQR